MWVKREFCTLKRDLQTHASSTVAWGRIREPEPRYTQNDRQTDRHTQTHPGRWSASHRRLMLSCCTAGFLLLWTSRNEHWWRRELECTWLVPWWAYSSILVYCKPSIVAHTHTHTHTTMVCLRSGTTALPSTGGLHMWHTNTILFHISIANDSGWPEFVALTH